MAISFSRQLTRRPLFTIQAGAILYLVAQPPARIVRALTAAGR
jgi:hypothetical protein